jgi:DNA anti-recombination protein RmuC
MPKSPKARKESSKREREEGRMSEEGLNPFRKSSRTERSPSRGEEINQSKEIEQKIETVLREIKEDMAGIVEESRARRKELAAAREKEGEQEREDMLKSSEVRKESSKREREEGRTQKEGKNSLRNSYRTRRSPNRSEEENQSKEMDKEMKTTMIRVMREEIKTLRKELAAVREGAKERISDSERGDERKRRKRAGGEGRLDEKDDNDRGKDGTKRKEGEAE